MTDDPRPPIPPPDDPPGLRERFPELMREFRAIARRMLRRLPAPSIASDDLVSEVYLKLLREEARRLSNNHSNLGSKTDPALKACFGMACRDVLSVRWRKRERRREVDLNGEPQGAPLSQFDLADIDEMLSVLATSKPEMARVVELRVFGDLTVSECADVLGIAPRTVDRHWAVGKAWIKRELSDRPDD